jgi:hypothetical protein
MAYGVKRGKQKSARKIQKTVLAAASFATPSHSAPRIDTLLRLIRAAFAVDLTLEPLKV